MQKILKNWWNFLGIGKVCVKLSKRLHKRQRRVHSGTLHSTIQSSARSGVDLLHSTPLEVVDWELDWISDGVECSYPTPGQLLF